MLEVLIKAALTFLVTVGVHIIVWRIHRPVSYRGWLPALLGLFVVGGALVAAALVQGPRLTGGGTIGEPLVEWCAIALLHGAVGLVYTIGYTLLLVGSPSLVILERLSAAPGGLRIDDVGLPMTADDLVGMRMEDLTRSGLVTADPRARHLTPKGRRLTWWVLLYRHMIGLPDGEGG